jgi:hypothetical protein
MLAEKLIQYAAEVHTGRFFFPENADKLFHRFLRAAPKSS